MRWGRGLSDIAFSQPPKLNGGDSNPPALLTTYSSNHSLSVSDNLLPQGMISPSQRPSSAEPYSVRFPNPAFQPLSVRCLFGTPDVSEEKQAVTLNLSP